MGIEQRIFDRFQACFPVKFKDADGDFGIGLQFDEVDFMKMQRIFKYSHTS